MGQGISPVVIAIAAGILVMVVLVVRARWLSVTQSVLWILAAAIAVIATLFYPLVEVVAPFLGVVYTPSAVFFLGILFLLLVTFHLSIRISRLEDERVRMAQTVALLEAELRSRAGPPEADVRRRQ